MSIRFGCPRCAVVIRVEDNLAGKKGECPKCKHKLSVPEVIHEQTFDEELEPPHVRAASGPSAISQPAPGAMLSPI